MVILKLLYIYTMTERKKDFLKQDLFQLIDGANSNLANRVLLAMQTSIRYKALKGSDTITVAELIKIFSTISQIQEEEISKYTGI